MASFNGTRIPGPMFNQNFSPRNLNMNLGGERQSFQRFPTPPFQQPEMFMSGNFPNRLPFSNFRNPTFSQGYRNRPPIPRNASPANVLSTPRPRFGRSFELPFTPWNQRPSFTPPRQPFQSHPRPSVPSRNNRGGTFQPNKQKKQKQREFRKLKEDNTEKPFSCDTCDRAFLTDGDLNMHLSEHITCDQGNCSFEAHPKVVAIHKKMQHDTGFAERINKLKDDAEIQKWREERRNRFPTAENIRKRQAEQAEREARGEVLETKEFGKFKRQRTEDGNSGNRGNRRKMRNHRNRNFHDRKHFNFQSHPSFKPVVLDVDSESDSDTDSHITLKRFPGILSLATSACNNLNIEDEVNSDYFIANDMNQSLSENEQNLPKCNSRKPPNIQNFTVAGESSNIVRISDESTFQSNKKSKGGNKTSAQPSGGNRPRAEPSGSKADGNWPKVIPDEKIASASGRLFTKENRVHRPNQPQFTVEGTITPEDSDDESFSHRNGSANLTALGSDDESPVVVPIIKCKDTAAGSSKDLPKNSSGVANSNTSSNKGKRDFVDLAESPPKRAKLDCNDGSNSRDCNGNVIERDITPAARNMPKNASLIANYDTGCNKRNSVNIGKEQDRRRGNHSQNNNRFNGGQDPAFAARKSSLLEKLLADDIRHERNVILQCVRHIVNKNFFGIGGNKSN